MTFYTYEYIVAHSHFDSMLLYVLSFLLLAALFAAVAKYFRNRLATKYRDLIVLFFLALLFLGGIQWNEYSRTESDAESASRTVAFLEALARQKETDPRVIRANATQIRQGMLVDVDGTYYAVRFSTDFSAFTLDEVYLVSDKVTTVDRDK